MAELKTDEETVEDIKKWWKENGTAIVAGVVIGLGAIFGWRAWSDYRDGIGQRASLALEQVLVATAGEETESAMRQAEKLTNDFGGTTYAMLAQLALAKTRLDAGEPQAAMTALAAAVEQAPDPGLARLTALRLARLQIDQDALDAADQTIDSHDDGGPFHGDFTALRGDIAAARGETESAVELYREALDAGAANSRIIALLLAEMEPETIPGPETALESEATVVVEGDEEGDSDSNDDSDAAAVGDGPEMEIAVEQTETLPAAPAERADDQPAQPAGDDAPAEGADDADAQTQ